MAKQNNELLMKNHQSIPTDSSAFPEVNATSYNHNSHGSNRGHEGCHNYRNNNNKIASKHKKLENNKNPHPNDKIGQGKWKVENICHRCGKISHCSCTCRSLKYFIDLYQATLKSKEKLKYRNKFYSK